MFKEEKTNKSPTICQRGEQLYFCRASTSQRMRDACMAALLVAVCSIIILILDGPRAEKLMTGENHLTGDFSNNLQRNFLEVNIIVCCPNKQVKPVTYLWAYKFQRV